MSDHMDNVWQAIQDDVPGWVWEMLDEEQRRQVRRFLSDETDPALRDGSRNAPPLDWEKDWKLIPNEVLPAVMKSIEKHRDALIQRRAELLRERDRLTWRIAVATGGEYVMADGGHRKAVAK